MSRLTENLKRLEEIGKLNRYHMGIIEDSLKEYEKEIRAKAIDDFLKKICEKYTEEERQRNYKQYCCDIKNGVADIAEQLKGGAE